MKLKLLAILCTFFAVMASGSPAFATDLNRETVANQVADPNIAALKAVGDAGDYPGADVVVIYDSTDVDVQDSGLSYVYMHKLTKILTSKGAKDLRSIVFDYDPLSAAVDVLSVRIYRRGGTVETVAASRVHDYEAPARAIYWGARQKLIDIGRLEAGDAVETLVFRKGFTYALLYDEDDDSRFVPPMKGHFYDIIEFWSAVPVVEKVYRVLVPEDKPMQYEIYNGELASSILRHPTARHRYNVQMNPVATQHDSAPDGLHPTAGMYTREGKITYTFSRKNINPFKREPNMVAPSDVAPKLLLSTSPDWYAKSLWFHGVNEDFGSFDVTPEVQAMTDELLKGVTEELEIISILNHWVAEEIRYSGINMGKGEGYTLHPGAMTFADRCGVCKDKAGMLVTMLRAAGMESYPAMTMAGSRIDRIPADQFNHSVTVVKRSSGDWMLLDPTWIPGVREMWSSAEQQQEFLMGIPGGADIMTTPVSPADNHYWRARAESRLDDEGTLEGTLTIEAEGQSDALLRRAFGRKYKSAWEDYYPGLFYAVSPDAEVLEVRMPDIGDLSIPFSVTIRYRIPNYAVVTDDRIVFTPLLAANPFSDYSNAPELTTKTSLENRQYGFRIRCSKLVELDETIELPSYENKAALPVFEKKQGASASFEASYHLDGRSLRFHAVHRMEKRVYDAADWPEFRAALLERERLSTETIVLAR